MYDITKVAETIKVLAGAKGYTVAALLKACGLGKDTINTMARRGSWIQANSLAKIADELDVSVDYLLGRTDNPQAHKTGFNVAVGDNSGNNAAIGVVSNVAINGGKVKGNGQVSSVEVSFSEQLQSAKQEILQKITETLSPLPKTGEEEKYHINVFGINEKERKELEGKLRFYELHITKSARTYIEFSAYSGFDIVLLGVDVFRIEKLS